jgi:hypothetical protein
MQEHDTRSSRTLEARLEYVHRNAIVVIYPAGTYARRQRVVPVFDILIPAHSARRLGADREPTGPVQSHNTFCHNRGGDRRADTLHDMAPRDVCIIQE